MNHHFKIKFALFCVFACLINPGLSKAQFYDTLPPSTFSVDSTAVVSSPIPHVGDTIHMLIRFHANVTGAGVFSMGCTGNIAPPTGGSGSDSTIAVDSGSEYTYSIPLKLIGYGGSLVEAMFKAISAPEGMINYAYTHLEVESSPTRFRVLNLGNNANDTGTMTALGILGAGAHIIIKGVVDYHDIAQSQADSAIIGHDTTIMRGVYGVTVVLLFHPLPFAGAIQGCSSDSLNITTFTHPVAGCTPSGYGLTDPGIHSCKCDADGNFSFDFRITDTTWANYANAELLVTASNDAARLASDPGDEVSTYTINGSGTTCPPWHTFRETYGICIPCNNTNLIYETGDTIKLNSVDGPILRNMEMAREYDILRPGVTPPQITTIISALAGADADFSPSIPPYIQFNPIAYSAAYPDHEFGHYCNWLLMDSSLLSEFTTDAYNIDEGWAQFHSQVVRWYTRANYGDIIDVGDVQDFEAWTFRSDYATIGAQQQVACFLCNVYDKYDDPGFRDPDFDNKNNDDIGEPLSIFQVTSPSYSYSGVSDFKNNIKSLFYTVEDSSIEDIYQYTLGDRSILMRPAQVKNLSNGQIGEDCAGPDDGSLIGNSFHVTLSWTPQEYGDVEYLNAPEGIHVYQSDDDGSTYTLIQGLAADATSTDICFFDCYPIFKVSTYNTSGDAYGAPTDTVYAECGNMKMADGHPGLVSDTTGLDVTVHPNPANSTTRICVADLPGGVPAIVEVVNQEGEVVATLYNATPDAELGLCLSLDCSNLPSGIYYAHVSNAIMGRAVKLSVSH